MIYRSVLPNDQAALLAYFQGLSPETHRRFAPHPFDEATIKAICHGQRDKCIAYVAVDQDKIVAYAIVLQGYTRGEHHRYQAYDVALNERNDYTLAPSVADAYQSQGIGSALYQYVERELRALGAQKIVLWGGVQLSNQRAVRFYLKHGFRTLAQFQYQGANLDMVKVLFT
ncbi:MAG: GNAT family N-acetyltransferase [Bacteroidota bacterium]